MDSYKLLTNTTLYIQVKVAWNKSSYHPGETAKVLLHTSAGSICSFIQNNALQAFSVDVLDVKNLLLKKKGIESYQELYSAGDNCIKPGFVPIKFQTIVIIINTQHNFQYQIGAEISRHIMKITIKTLMGF